MAYQVLARKWRPSRFADVVGQRHVTTTLENAIRTGRLAHAFLFCGPRGVGKTTTARILAKCLNCETATDGPVVEPCNECAACRETAEGRSLDVLEIDGASNRGIDEIRDLRENVRYAPSGGRAKVYIIDEVHMLTKEAFNALLKTLEEPPPAVYFVFATTEIHKVPATIRSRCQRYDFHRIASDDIEATLTRLAESESFQAEPDALKELARCAEGGLRDAQSLLDQAAAVGEGTVTLAGVRSLLGEADGETTLAIARATAEGDTGEAYRRLQTLLDLGLDPGRVAESLTQAWRDLLVVRTAPDDAETLGVRADLRVAYGQLADTLSVPKLTAMLALASRTVTDIRRSARPRLTLEVALARLCRLQDPGELEELVARVERLRGELGGDGSGGQPATPSPPSPTGGTSPSPPRKRPAPDRPAPSPKPPRATDPPAKPKRGGTRAAWEQDDVPPDEIPPVPDEAPPAEGAGPESAAPPAAPESAPAPAAPVTPGDSEATRIWQELLQRVARRKTMLGSFLEHGAAVGWDGSTLSTVFENTYYEGMVKRRENLEVIQEELQDAVGHPATLRVRVGAVPIANRPAEATDGPASGKPTESRDLLDDNPGLKRAIHDLGGHLLPGGS